VTGIGGAVRIISVTKGDPALVNRHSVVTSPPEFDRGTDCAVYYVESMESRLVEISEETRRRGPRYESERQREK
jgi:hypothetical protein